MGVEFLSKTNAKFAERVENVGTSQIPLNARQPGRTDEIALIGIWFDQSGAGLSGRRGRVVVELLTCTASNHH